MACVSGTHVRTRSLQCPCTGSFPATKRALLYIYISVYHGVFDAVMSRHSRTIDRVTGVSSHVWSRQIKGDIQITHIQGDMQMTHV